jgi:hypothetical protein
LTDTSADGVYATTITPYSDLCSLTGLTDDGFDFNMSTGDLWHFAFKKLRNKVG